MGGHDSESGQSATEKEALLLKFNQLYIRSLVSTTALLTLLQALRTKSNLLFIRVMRGLSIFQSAMGLQR